MEWRKSYLYVGFLLGLSSQCISRIRDPNCRLHLMRDVTERILSTFVSIEDILVHPYRLRYRLLRSRLQEIRDNQLESAFVLAMEGTSSSGSDEKSVGKATSKYKNPERKRKSSVARLRRGVIDSSEDGEEVSLVDSLPLRQRENILEYAKQYLKYSKEGSTKFEVNSSNSSSSIQRGTKSTSVRIKNLRIYMYILN